MSPNAAMKGNALWKPGTERSISMDTSKALTKEEAPQMSGSSLSFLMKAKESVRETRDKNSFSYPTHNL